MKEETNCLSTLKNLVIKPEFRSFKTFEVSPLPPAQIMPFKNKRQLKKSLMTLLHPGNFEFSLEATEFLGKPLVALLLHRYAAW